MECPNCKHPLQVNRTVMAQESITLNLSWEGSLVEAATISGMIGNTSALLEKSAKSVGIPSDVFVESIDWKDKAIAIHFLVIPRPGQRTHRAARP